MLFNKLNCFHSASICNPIDSQR